MWPESPWNGLATESGRSACCACCHVITLQVYTATPARRFSELMSLPSLEVPAIRLGFPPFTRGSRHSLEVSCLCHHLLCFACCAAVTIPLYSHISQTLLIVCVIKVVKADNRASSAVLAVAFQLHIAMCLRCCYLTNRNVVKCDHGCVAVDTTGKAISLC